MMENPVHSNKKTILLAAAAIVATLLMLFIAIFAINAGKSTSVNKVSEEVAEDNKENAQKITSNEETALEKSTETPVEAGWNNYKNSSYSIDYPSDWEAKEVVFTGGGTGQSIKPVANTSNASFSIAVDSSSSVQTAKQKQQDYKVLGFKESVFQVGGLPATKISGQLPPKTTSGTPPAITMQSTYIFFERGGQGYFVEYAYTGVGVDSQLENTFQTMISSIKFL